MKRLSWIAAAAIAPMVSFAQTPHELTLTWEPPTDSETPIAGYHVLFNDNRVPVAGDDFVDVGKATEFVFPNPDLPLPQDDEYWLSVRSYYAGLTSTNNPVVRVTVEFAPPSPPQNLQVDIRPIDPAQPPD